MQSIWREPMQSISLHLQESSGLDVTSRAFLKESSGQLESLFETMLALAENPTAEAIIAIVESYIQMNRVISSISLIDQAYSLDLTIDNFAKYRQSVDPTLRFLLQVHQEERYTRDNNALKLAQGNYGGMRKSILDETTIWLKQHLAQIPVERKSALVKIIKSQSYASSIACLEKSSNTGKLSASSLPVSLALMLSSLRKTISHETEYYKSDIALTGPISSHYLAKFAVIESEAKYTRGLLSTLYSNKLYDVDSCLQWIQSYMEFQLSTIFESKPQVSLNKSFLHDYNSEKVHKKEQSPPEKTAAILGLFLISVQYNYLRGHVKNNEDTAYIMRKLILLQRSSVLVQEFTAEDIQFLLRQINTAYVKDAAENIYNLLHKLDAATVTTIATGFSTNNIGLLIKTLRQKSIINKHGKVYQDLGLWVEYLVYLFNRKAGSFANDECTKKQDLQKDFTAELSDFNYFRLSFNSSLTGIVGFTHGPTFVESDSSPYAIQTARSYNSGRYGVVPVFTLRQVLFKFNMPLELFAETIASAYMSKEVFYRSHEMLMLDLACEDIPLKDELFLAIDSNDLSTVRATLKYDARLLDSTNSNGLSPLKAAIMTDHLDMVKMIISNIILSNKHLGITDNIALPLKFAIANGKKAAAEFFADKLGLPSSALKELYTIEAPVVKRLDSIENLANKFRVKYLYNIPILISDFLCKLSCVSLLMWVVAVIFNIPMFATIFALSTCIPLLVTCLMHCLVNSLSFFSVTDSLAAKLGYGGISDPGSKNAFNPEMASSYATNVMPEVYNNAGIEPRKISADYEIGVK
jgi:hypothetical protein